MKRSISIFSAFMDTMPWDTALAVGLNLKSFIGSASENPFWLTLLRYQAGSLEASERIHRDAVRL